MAELVECQSGFTYAEKPTALTWLGQRLIISRILSQRRTPQGKWFRVYTADGQYFELFYFESVSESISDQEWQIHPL
jgi:hypothetical protein